MVADDEFGLPKATKAVFNVKRVPFALIIVLVSLLAAEIPEDIGRYEEALREFGVLGFVSLPSIVIAQALYVVVAVSMLHHFWPTRRVGVIVMSTLSIFAVLAYVSVLLCVPSLRAAGEFGYAAAGLLFMFVFFPSVAFLLICAPAVFISWLSIDARRRWLGARSQKSDVG